MLKVATVCTGIGSPEMALRNLVIPHEIVFGCEIDKYARQTYLANFNPGFMEPDMTQCDWEYEKYYSDLFIGGIPCQAFSLAGKRLGELDPRGLLFFDFYRYVKNQNPKYFIIENVKGLLSDNAGATFQNWINLLGQSVNGDQFMFPHEDSLMYNLHWQVLNTKDYGLPQNRERVFLIGIRNDLPNTFVFPKGVPLKLRLKDILEPEVDEKYYLSDKMLNYLTTRKDNFNNGKINFKGENDIASCINASSSSLDISDNILKVENIGNVNPSGNGMNGNVFSENGISPTLTTNKGEGIKIQIASATKSGYEIATEGDSINLEHPNSETRRGRVGKQVAQTLTTSCNQGVMVSEKQYIVYDDYNGNIRKDNLVGTLTQNCGASAPRNGQKIIEETVVIGAMRGRNPENKSDRSKGAPTQQMLEINENGTSNCLTSVQKDNLVIQINPSLESGGVQPYQQNRIYDSEGIAPALCRGKSDLNVTENEYRIRKLTPREVFRLQGFPDEFLQNAIDAGVSNSQLYKQAGNSISVPVIQAILKNLLT